MASFLKIIFAGTSNFSAQHLNFLISSPHKIIGVFTQPDRPAGRGQNLQSSPVKFLAQHHNIPVFQPKTMKSQKIYQKILNLQSDLIVVVSYGLILPPEITELPRFGCINVHASLLPRWRGAAPIQRAILAGDSNTGITVIQMDSGIDTGKILYKISCPITLQDTSASINDKLIKIGIYALNITLKKIMTNTLKPIKQTENRATYAKKISKEEARLNWSLTAKNLLLLIRAFNPWPVSFFYNNKKLIKVWHATIIKNQDINFHKPGQIILVNKYGLQVATKDDILNIEVLQIEGKKKMGILDLVNARKPWFIPGTILK